MNVLFLPHNMASIPAITAMALNKHKGICTRSIDINEHKFHLPAPDTIYLQQTSSDRLLRHFFCQSRNLFHFLRLLLWADVIHYTWDAFLPRFFDLRLIRMLRKPGVVEWLGSDIRCPGKSFPINPYLKYVYEKGYEYANVESDQRSAAVQRRFAEAGLEPVVAPEMDIYVDKELFSVTHILMQRINVRDITVSFPEHHKERPLVVHSPSAIIAKGTPTIIEVVKELQQSYSFDFVLLQNMPRAEVQRKILEADIFLDQLIIGGYGMASLEAMSMGKPVITYVMDEVYHHGLPKDCPVVNANPDNLKQKLSLLLKDSSLRNELGRKGRNFAETYHDSEKIAPQLIELYEGVIARRRNRR